VLELIAIAVPTVVMAMVVGPFAAAADLTVTPGEGPPGSELIVSGTGFQPGKQVKVRWDGDAFPGTVSIDGAGTFAVTITVPRDASVGPHAISVRETGRGPAPNATFMVVSATVPTTTVAPPTTVTTTTVTTTTVTATTVVTTTRPPAATSTTAAPGTTTVPAAPGSPTTTAAPTERDPQLPGASLDVDTPPPAASASGPTVLQVDPVRAVPGQEVFVALSGADPSLGEVRLQLDESDVSEPVVLSRSGAAEFRFLVPESADWGTHKLAVVVGEGDASREIARTRMSIVESADVTTHSSWVPVLLAAAAALGGIGYFVWPRRHAESGPSPAARHSTPTAPTAPAPAAVPPLTTGGGWSRRLLGVAHEEPRAFEDLAAVGRELWAVGAEGAGRATAATVWASPDGSSWNQVGALGAGKATSLAVGGDRLIVAGSQPPRAGGRGWEWAVWTSEDGSAWRPLLDDGPRPRGIPLGVAAAGATILVFGRSSQRAELWLMGDGAQLSRVPTPGAIESVAHTARGFVAFGKGDAGHLPMVLVSEDGRRWDELALSLVAPFNGCSVAAQTEFGGSLVAGGVDVVEHRAAVWVSDDGRHWEAAPLTSQRGTSVTHLVSTPDSLIAVGTDRNGLGSGTVGSIAAWATSDGVRWERLGEGEILHDAAPSAAAHLGGQLVLAGRVYAGGDPEQPGIPSVWSHQPGEDTSPGDPPQARRAFSRQPSSLRSG
jgi:hypothetical protein